MPPATPKIQTKLARNLAPVGLYLDIFSVEMWHRIMKFSAGSIFYLGRCLQDVQLSSSLVNNLVASKQSQKLIRKFKLFKYGNLRHFQFFLAKLAFSEVMAKCHDRDKPVFDLGPAIVLLKFIAFHP